jgi:hypothetical protein
MAAGSREALPGRTACITPRTDSHVLHSMTRMFSRLIRTDPQDEPSSYVLVEGCQAVWTGQHEFSLAEAAFPLTGRHES